MMMMMMMMNLKKNPAKKSGPKGTYDTSEKGSRSSSGDAGVARLLETPSVELGSQA